MSQNGPDQDPWGKPGQSSGPKQSDNSSDKQNENGWGARDNKNQEQSPPDIEEVFNNLLKKLGGGNKKGGSNNTSPNMPSFNLGKILPIAVVIGGIIWGASGFYTIKEAERGVTLRFGEFHSIVQPGLNWKPTFVDKVIPVNVEQVRELKTQGAMLTKDENMVKVEMTVQYRVQNPEKYLFSVSNADNSLGQATDSALRYVIGHMTMNDVLTTGRAVVREDTWKALNDIIKPYDMGLEVIDVNFQSARPPEEVKDAFDDAIKAQEDEQRYIREAEAYAREKEPIARGDAQRIVEEATAYKDRIVLDAQGEVERLQRLLPEFKAAPDLLKERLYIQTMEKVMANTPKVMLDSNNGNNLTVLPLEQLMGKKATKPMTTTSESAVSSAPVSIQDRRVETQVAQPVQSSEGIRQGRFN
ncbi:HflK protein [Haemophilus parainfluenzae ATCC 33392]|uniref:Protein HflK n=1 Tax=Haemophilus parainfluenzae ATCC 33392 TaxID=888828 RepID=A0ABD7ZI08_HAEPA|nr:FtsH protease activity modulator HflK [Haemophilus parainfluenzae]KFL99209.1 HflK protein [Haemophilus parainfluenzae ATCC 33392]QQB22351.1 FtsH protease activity modulator HflK [Haemophilus parainfluenzae]WMS24000.1 FtsH protease activity modulator HflK [Haemophilus parainfluenzae ATCC 33392]STO95298.1 Modulator of FtsH protease HflK [Haemophilus parainfluenzae ATCC 33392]